MRLTTRISIYFVILTIIMVLVLSSALFLQFRQSYSQLSTYSVKTIKQELLERTQKRGEVITALLAENLVNPFYAYDMQTIHELLTVTQNQEDILYTILYDADGKIVHTGDENLHEFGKPINDTDSFEAIKTRNKTVFHISDEVMDISVPIWIGETPLGGIKVGLSLANISAYIRTMSDRFEAINQETFKYTFFIVSAASVIFIFIIVITTIYLVLQLIRPIRELKNNALAIGTGDYSQSISESYPGEIGELAMTFNQMKKDLMAHELSLKKSEKKYRHLFNNAPVGIYEINITTSQIISVNDIICKFFGYSEAEFLLMDPIDLFAPESREMVIEQLDEVKLTKKQSDSIECLVVKKDGQKANGLLSYDFDFKSDGTIISRAVLHDITQRVELEKKKIEAQQMIADQAKYALVGQIAGKMAHDFNNILGIIMANSEFSLLSCEDDEIKETLEMILEQTVRGQSLTRNLLAFAKDQAPNQEYFYLKEKIDLVLNLLKKDLKPVEIIRDDDPHLPEVLADPGMIENALVNLIINSVHATSKVENPRITIRTYSNSQKICIEVQDNGCGIPEHHFESIFEPAFTLKGTKDEGGFYASDIRGTGYGLANVKKYIEQHKGSILIDSEVGTGTTIVISLLKVEKELSSKEKQEIHDVVMQTHKRILLVEDEQTLSRVQYQILADKPFFHMVDVAPNGEMAKSLFSKKSYDLISLDNELPGKLKGIDVYHEIRKTDQTTPVLFNSGNLEFLESIEDLKKKDPHMDAISKPCKNKAFLDIINHLLERSNKVYIP